MKRLHALLLVLIFIFCGCDKVPTVSENSSEYDSSSENMTVVFQTDIDFYMPSEFSRTSTQTNNVAYVSDNASVIVNEDDITKQSSSLSAYVSYSKELYSEIADKYEVLSNENLTVNSFNAVITEFNYEINGENDTLAMTCLVGFYYDSVNMPSSVYIVTCKAETENYQNYRAEFMKILTSVRLR